jgi:hypothetical protein
MTRSAAAKLAAVVSCALAACSTPGGAVIRAIPYGEPPFGKSPADPTFQVVARLGGAKDPLPVSGGHVAYADLDGVLGEAVLRAVEPRSNHVLTVELIAGDAGYDSGRLSISLVVRATLRTRLGNTFIAQTQAVCREGAIVEPEVGTKVLWACMTHLGQDLAGWLAGLPRETLQGAR